MADANRSASDPTGQDVDRSGLSRGDADAGKILEGLDEDILEEHDFPGSGAEPEPDAGGSTGRDARDAGKVDPGGEPGGGMAGSAGG